MKTVIIVDAYRKINDAKLSKMDDKDKFVMIKVMRAMKPVATAFEDLVKDAREKLKDEDYEQMQKDYEELRQRGSDCGFSYDKIQSIIQYIGNYEAKVEECVKPDWEKENELTYDRLSEDAFGKFLASNDFDMKTIMVLQDVLM